MTGTKLSFWGKLAAGAAVVLTGEAIFWQAQWGGSGFGLLALALLLAVAAVRVPLWRSGPARIGLGLAALYAAALFHDPGLIALALFLIALAVTTLLPQVGRFGDGWQWIQRLFYHGVRSIFAPVIDAFRLLRLKSKRGPSSRGLRKLLPLMILPVIGSAVFLALFAAANPVIAGWMDAVHWPAFDVESVAHLLFWGLLFWLAWSFLRPRLLPSVSGTFAGRGDLKLPGFSPQSLTLSLIAFNLVFALQTVMDVAYLGGFAPLPQGMTLAEYAHRGAYPLIATALLAGLFTIVTLRPGSTSARDPLTRRLLTAWIAQNIFLVGSSIERTLDYVRVYSLTQLRIAALAWMGLVALGLTLICWRMLKDKSASWLINSNLAAAGVLLTGFAIVDTGAMAAQWNVRHAREVGGEGAALDLCYLEALGGSALLPLVELEQRGDLAPGLHQKVRQLRGDLQSNMAFEQAHGWWTWRDARRLEAAESRGGAVKVWNPSEGGFDCARPPSSSTLSNRI